MGLSFLLNLEPGDDVYSIYLYKNGSNQYGKSHNIMISVNFALFRNCISIWDVNRFNSIYFWGGKKMKKNKNNIDMNSKKNNIPVTIGFFIAGDEVSPLGAELVPGCRWRISCNFWQKSSWSDVPSKKCWCTSRILYEYLKWWTCIYI